MMQLLSHVGPFGVAVIPAHPAPSEDEVTRSRYDKRASLSPGRLFRESSSLHSSSSSSLPLSDSRQCAREVFTYTPRY